MEAFAWAAHHWLDLLQSVGIIGGLFFTAASLSSMRTKRRWHASAARSVLPEPAKGSSTMSPGLENA